jgi:hypothetical protein
MAEKAHGQCVGCFFKVCVCGEKVGPRGVQKVSKAGPAKRRNKRRNERVTPAGKTF